MSSLRKMLQARSVAVIGASTREESLGNRMVGELSADGFSGRVYPVNPRYSKVRGQPCYPSISELPEVVDLALLGVSNALLEEQLYILADAGVGAAVIFGSCYETPRLGVPPLAERLGRIAADAGMSICGGNGMGFINFETKLRALAYWEPQGLEPGGISWISHSGSVFSSLLRNRRGLRFNMAVSSGQEIATTAADYMHYALELPSTRMIALFLETVRDPLAFRTALKLAADRGVPVVALKVGREPAAREAVSTHSGALAGDDAAYEALFDSHGVVRVWTLDELANTAELLLSGRRAATGGLAALHDSGGERAHLIDVAGDVGVPLADIGPKTRERLAGVLDDELASINPVDAWGGAEPKVTFGNCMRALLDDADTAALAFVVDMKPPLSEPVASYAEIAEEISAYSTKPFAILANSSDAVDPELVGQIRGTGIPVLHGTADGLKAFRHLFAYRDFVERPSVREAKRPNTQISREWRSRLQQANGPLPEAAALRLLSAYGVPAVHAAEASSQAGVMQLVEQMRMPVALKTANPQIHHKANVDGVRLGLGSPEAVAQAYTDLARRLGRKVTVSEMASAGLEIAFGMVRDPQFGPVIVVAAGGGLTEVLQDRSVANPPIDETISRRLISRLRIGSELAARGKRAPHDVDGLVSALVNFSTLIGDLGDYISAVDVNPLIVNQDGCCAVDALIVPRTAATASAPEKKPGLTPKL